MSENEILLCLQSIEQVKNVSKTRNPVLNSKGLGHRFEFDIEEQGNLFHFLIFLPTFFPLYKPEYFLLNKEEFNYSVNINSSGLVCYTHDENLLIDESRPRDVIIESLNLALSTIINSLVQVESSVFFNEFEAYWKGKKGIENIISNLGEHDYPTKVKVINGEKAILISSDEKVRLEESHRIIGGKAIQINTGLYVPLDESPEFLWENQNIQITTATVKKLLSRHLSKGNQTILSDLLAKKCDKVSIVIFSFNDSNKTRHLFGVKFPKTKAILHPLVDSNEDNVIELIPLNVSKFEREYLVPRGGNGLHFFDRKVLLIGCGSLGGFIADELTRCGVLSITCVDDDKLTEENIYRHLLGYGYYGKNKAEALKQQIESNFPHSSIMALPQKIEYLIENRKIQFGDFDVIIVATGNATINRHINSSLRKRGVDTTLVFTWLEPYGIGGHCLITQTKECGCYHCLYNDDYNSSFYNLASFLDRTQPKSILKSISGCGSVYLPYSSIDSRKTAILCVEQVIRALLKKINKSEIHSWKGSAKLLEENGFIVSERYKQTQALLDDKIILSGELKCGICSNG